MPINQSEGVRERMKAEKDRLDRANVVKEGSTTALVLMEMGLKELGPKRGKGDGNTSERIRSSLHSGSIFGALLLYVGKYNPRERHPRGLALSYIGMGSRHLTKVWR